MSEDHHAPFGSDRFGRGAEKAARFFGTPGYIIGQSIAVVVWIALNSLALVNHWDPYPFILLNLLFSTQAAYAAPLILLAQTRQAERDRLKSEAYARHQEVVESALERHSQELRAGLEENTELTREIRDRLA
jgi:uncharacterized membrane protein